VRAPGATFPRRGTLIAEENGLGGPVFRRHRHLVALPNGLPAAPVPIVGILRGGRSRKVTHQRGDAGLEDFNASRGRSCSITGALCPASDVSLGPGAPPRRQ